MLRATLSAEQEAEAKILEAKIQKAIQTEITDLARLMVSKPDRELFGQTEFQVRDLVLRIGAKVFQEHLREKKNGYQGSGVRCLGVRPTSSSHGTTPPQRWQ